MVVDSKGTNYYQKRTKRIVVQDRSDISSSISYLQGLEDISYQELYAIQRKSILQALSGLYNQFLSGEIDTAKYATAVSSLARSTAIIHGAQTSAKQIEEINPKIFASMSSNELIEYSKNLISKLS